MAGKVTDDPAATLQMVAISSLHPGPSGIETTGGGWSLALAYLIHRWLRADC
jgi:hypothetical protein